MYNQVIFHRLKFFMPILYQTDEITFTPFKRELQEYSWNQFRQDATAALNVALLTVPQGMAFALLAGLPLFCGVFAAVYSATLAALFGSSRHLISGPSNAIVILIQTATAEILFSQYRDLAGPERELMAIQILTQISLLIGLFQVVAAGLKLGRLTHFVSHSVIVGYITGTVIAVVINQLFNFLGVPKMEGIASLYEKAVFFVTNLPLMHMQTALLGGGSLALLVGLKRLNKKIPAAVITLVAAAAITHLFDLHLTSEQEAFIDPYGEETIQSVALLGDSGTLSDVSPHFQFPYFDTGIMNTLLPVAFAAALLSVMESVSVAKSVAAQSGQRLSTNQEMLGVGLGNLLSSLIGALPVSGAPGRTAINLSEGAQTRVAGLLNGVFACGIIYLLGFLVTAIPSTALSALLIVNALGVLNLKHLRMCIKATKADALVLWITLFSCIFFSLDIAFYIGVMLSITLYLNKAGLPQLIEYNVDKRGALTQVNANLPQPPKAIRVIKVRGELFFGAADPFQATLKSIAEDDNTTKVIVLQLKNARDIDATACLALEQLYESLKQQGRSLIACGITPDVWEVFSDSGLIELLGKENLFILEDKPPHHYLERAIHRAEMIAAETHLPQQTQSSRPLEISVATP